MKGTKRNRTKVAAVRTTEPGGGGHVRLGAGLLPVRRLAPAIDATTAAAAAATASSSCDLLCDAAACIIASVTTKPPAPVWPAALPVVSRRSPDEGGGSASRRRTRLPEQASMAPTGKYEQKRVRLVGCVARAGLPKTRGGGRYVFLYSGLFFSSSSVFFACIYFLSWSVFRA